MTVWVVLDITEWSRDVVGVFATRDAAISAMDRTSSWGFSLEEWVVEGDEHPVSSDRPASSGGSPAPA